MNANHLTNLVISAPDGLAPALSQRSEDALASRLKAHPSYSASEIETISSMVSRFVNSDAQLSDKECERLREMAILSRCSLRYLQPITSHRKFVGPIIVFGKKLLWKLLYSQLRKQFEAMEEFNGAVVENIAREMSQQRR